jgi:hypothetical protein
MFIAAVAFEELPPQFVREPEAMLIEYPPPKDSARQYNLTFR